MRKTANEHSKFSWRYPELKLKLVVGNCVECFMKRLASQVCFACHNAIRYVGVRSSKMLVAKV